MTYVNSEISTGLSSKRVFRLATRGLSYTPVLSTLEHLLTFSQPLQLCRRRSDTPSNLNSLPGKLRSPAGLRASICGPIGLSLLRIR